MYFSFVLSQEQLSLSAGFLGLDLNIRAKKLKLRSKKSNTELRH